MSFQGFIPGGSQLIVFSLPPASSAFITTLEIEANLSLPLQKLNSFSLWVNKKATEPQEASEKDDKEG